MNETTEKTEWDYAAVALILGYLGAIIVAVLLHVSDGNKVTGKEADDVFGLVMLLFSFVAWCISIWFLIFSEESQTAKHKRHMQNGKEFAGYFTENNEFKVHSRLVSANNIMGWTLQIVSIGFLIWSYVVYIMF